MMQKHMWKSASLQRWFSEKTASSSEPKRNKELLPLADAETELMDCGHIVSANTKAIEMLGVDVDSPQFSDGDFQNAPQHCRHVEIRTFDSCLLWD